MLIEIPYREKEEKTDIRPYFQPVSNRSLTDEEDNCLKRLADYFTQCEIGYNGKWSTNFIKISKKENALIVEINDNLIKREKC
ncbi:MAG: hypothetical protein ACI4S1_07510 [Roseburia sp.]|mgnify:FL=1